MWCAQAQHLLPKRVSGWLAAELDQSLGKHFLVFVLEHHRDSDAVLLQLFSLLQSLKSSHHSTNGREHTVY